MGPPVHNSLAIPNPREWVWDLRWLVILKAGRTSIRHPCVVGSWTSLSIDHVEHHDVHCERRRDVFNVLVVNLLTLVIDVNQASLA